jgi:hypothetical protein
MVVDKYGNYLCGNSLGRIELTRGVDISLAVHSRAILKIVKSMCSGIKRN